MPIYDSVYCMLEPMLSFTGGDIATSTNKNC